MIDIAFSELMDYWLLKYQKQVRENEKLRIHNQSCLDEINTLRGKANSFEHKNMELLERLKHQVTENEHLLETIEGLHNKIKELEEENE